jgi:hypothetical protein
LLNPQADKSDNPFVLLREVSGSRVYLGAVCDAAGNVQEWLELWVQEPQLKSPAFGAEAKPLDNGSFDRLWRGEFERLRDGLGETVLVTGMESAQPRPVVIQAPGPSDLSRVVKVEPVTWRLCSDDQLLKAAGLPAYSGSCHRYLYEPEAEPKPKFIAISPEAPVNGRVQGQEQLASDGHLVFNRHAGLVGASRFSPLELEDYLQVLEGRAWAGPPEPMQEHGIYGALAQWSGERRASGFMLQLEENFGQRLEEVFFLKLTVLLELVRAVHRYVKAQQVPLLNLGSGSFAVSLPEVGDAFPALWAARFNLVRPSQACRLDIPLSQEKYFLRIGRCEPSVFLPEGLGAYGFGIGAIRLRQVLAQEPGVVWEGTLVAEDYLGLRDRDLLWFKLPLGEQRLEFFAHICASELVGPKEARFRTLPMVLPDTVAARLKAASGTIFQRTPYEICPLLSSPCDLYSLGVLGIRILLANSRSNLPVIVDEMLSLIQRVAKQSADTQSILAELRMLASKDRDALDRLSPQALIESGDSPEQARAKLPIQLWWEAIAVLFRFFPGLGPYSFSANLGEAPPEALERVFEKPIAELESLTRRLRSVLLPSVSANEELAQLLRDELTSP